MIDRFIDWMYGLGPRGFSVALYVGLVACLLLGVAIRRSLRGRA